MAVLLYVVHLEYYYQRSTCIQLNINSTVSSSVMEPINLQFGKLTWIIYRLQHVVCRMGKRSPAVRSTLELAEHVL